MFLNLFNLIFQNILYLLIQFGNFILDDVPNYLIINAEITMDQPVSHSGN